MKKVRFKKDYLTYLKGHWYNVTDRFAEQLARDKIAGGAEIKEDKEAAGRETKGKK
jgi:hypothetical protein